jgi:hypothetical protein
MAVVPPSGVAKADQPRHAGTEQPKRQSTAFHVSFLADRKQGKKPVARRKNRAAAHQRGNAV